MTLYLLPNLLGPLPDHRLFLPSSVDEVMGKLDGLIAESEGEGRRYLKRFKTKKKPNEMPIALFNKQAKEHDFLLEPLLKGESWGVVSDCGLPSIADPAASLVLRAKQLNIPICAFSGPSAITHALLLSGLPGQCFYFHGYIAKEREERQKCLRTWQKIPRTTHIFIEAPYRNHHTFQACLEVLDKDVLLCVAENLTLENERVDTFPIAHWRAHPKAPGKHPALFLFYPLKS